MYYIVCAYVLLFTMMALINIILILIIVVWSMRWASSGAGVGWDRYDTDGLVWDGYFESYF